MKRINEKDIPLYLQKYPFWDLLHEEEKEIFRRQAHLETFHKGETMSDTNEECKGPVVVLEGQIRVYMLSEEGREVTLYRLHEGDPCALSASCIMESVTFDVLMEAVEETTVLVVPASVFHSLQADNPQLELYLLRITNERFSDVMWTMQQILFLAADRRVATFLWDEMIKTKSTEIFFTHDEIARFIGSAREVVSRVLKYFAEEGVVRLGRGKIEILKKGELKKLV